MLETLSSLPVLTLVMIGAGAFFGFCFLLAFRWYPPAVILRFAPSIMTSLGLLGTFLELTESLKKLNLTNTGTIDNFVSQLQDVFQYSIMGIGSAIFFMLANFIINSIRLSKSKNEKEKLIEEQKERSDEIRKINKENNSNIKNINKNSDEIKNNNTENFKYIKALAQYAQAQYKLQEKVFSPLGDSITKMSQAIDGMQKGYDTELLSKSIADEIAKQLKEPLNDLSKSINNNNGDTIRLLLSELKDEVLTPIKNEIRATTNTTNQVIKAVQDSQETNKQLIEKLGETATQMQSFVSQTDILVKSMSDTVNQMEQIQKDAQTKMVGAINLATEAMNGAIKLSIDDLGDKVVKGLDTVLGDFNDNMDKHLDSMNTQLKQTGNNAKTLIDTSANRLKETMGEIDDTLKNLSQELQKELEEFRKEYDSSLTKFFEQQNEQLQNTIGVHSEAIKTSAENFKEQFDKMTKAHGDLNQKTKSVFEPLLAQMVTISGNVNQSQTTVIRDLTKTIEYGDKINIGLEKLGNDLGVEFAKRFETLNNEYIQKHNESNKAIEKLMNEMITSAAALLATSKLNNDE